MERHHTNHQAAHYSWGKNLPSVVGIGDSLPLVTVLGVYVRLPEKIDNKYAGIVTVVGDKYNQPTVLVRVLYAQLPSTIVARCIFPSILVGC